MNETTTATASSSETARPTPSTLDALTQAVWDDPFDWSAQAALQDHIEESGVTHLTAVRRVRKLVRAAIDEWHVALQTARVESATRTGGKLRAAIRDECEMWSQTIPIKVVAGNWSPTVTGHEAHWEFENGGICNAPYFARKKGYKVVYFAQTFEITVGATWLANNL